MKPRLSPLAIPAALLAFILPVLVLPAAAQAPVHIPQDAPARYHPLPPLREQAKEMQTWVAARLERVLPALMAEHGADMWILSMREYGEDPVFWSMISETTFAARRRSIYVFTRRPDGSVERLALGGGSQGGLFEIYRSPHPTPTGRQAELWGDEQWRLLREIVDDRKPATIVLNIDDTWAWADGLGAGERETLEKALGPDNLKKVKRIPMLAVDYIAVRVPEMMPRYRQMQETVHAIISEAFSNSVITPGVTTTEDVQWWLRQKLSDLGFTTWFQPSVAVQRAGESPPEEGAVVIRRGDMIWTDFGLVGMRLKTDTQHNGYILREGETDVPEGLKRCLAAGSRMQDIQVEELKPGRTGNEALAAALARMKQEGITGSLYSHPLGDQGHGAGPLIGLWDRQEGVPGRGDAKIRPSTWFSIELQATVPVPEWGGKAVNCRKEEDVWLDAEGNRHWAFRRQETFHLVW
ncbi:MAG TPA: M24 family metallopeptidase [Longimicrobiales bacterium]|nr:M24 family metallopeptidase [Longimicrobiales bacterium]